MVFLLFYFFALACIKLLRRCSWYSTWKHSKRKTQHFLHTHCAHDKNRFYKQLGLFSLKKKIEDAVLRAEMLAPLALELEEERRNEQEQLIRDYDLWDDTAESNEVLAKLADSVRVVDALRDLTYKAEEAKLITQLAEIDAINYGLFRKAYDAYLDMSKILNKYEISKLLKGP
ncbi:peptide chain release factor PrfB3, chloroplastic-like [Rosa chinensis]|nr:peptide chain release factor PrfB3, chloroplastic-like [Rosa chinensis]